MQVTAEEGEWKTLVSTWPVSQAAQEEANPEMMLGSAYWPKSYTLVGVADAWWLLTAKCGMVVSIFY